MDIEFQKGLLEYLIVKKIPASILENSSRFAIGNFKSMSKNYTIVEGALHKIVKNNQEETVKLLQCPTKNEIPELLKKYHDVSGHDGINTTYKIISREYYWKGMSQDVKDYIRNCHYCQVEALIPRNENRELHPIPPSSRPWKHLGIDLISDFGAVHDDFKHILGPYVI